MLLIYNNLRIVSKLLLWKLRIPVMPDPRPQESANAPAGEWSPGGGATWTSRLE